MVDRLILEVVEYEENRPEFGDYLNLKASVESDGFSGSTFCWLRAVDLDVFLEKLRNFSASLVGSVAIKAGVGEDVLFEIRLEVGNKRGHIRVAVKLAPSPRGAENCMNRLDIEFMSEVELIQEFGRQLSVLLNRRSIDEPAVLAGRP